MSESENTSSIHMLPPSNRPGLDKTRLSKPYLKERLHPLPGIEVRPPHSRQSSGKQQSRRSSIASVHEQHPDSIEYGDIDPWQRVQHLERSLVFLRQQHHSTLNSLHEDIELLRRENRDLHFKYVMLQQSRGGGSPPGSAPSSARSRREPEPRARGVGHKQDGHRLKTHAEKELTAASIRSRTVDDVISESQDDRSDELKIVFLEDEVRNLKTSMRASQLKNEQLGMLVRDERRKREAEKQAAAAKGDSPSALADAPLPPGVPPLVSLRPLQVLPTIGGAARQPTVTECEGIIRHLHTMSEKQAHELMHLKSDLKDVLYSSKWTPDAYLLARAYVADEDEEVGSRVALRTHGHKTVPAGVYQQRDTVLPALKQKLNSGAVERRKRAHILRKTGKPQS